MSYFNPPFNLRKTNKLISSQIKLYKNENPKIATIICRDTAEEVIGPNTGKSNTYRGKQIPKNNSPPFKLATDNFFCKCNNPHPKPKPSTPVVKGKINNSVGSIINKSNTVNA